MAEQNTERTIQVRQVTDIHANWNYEGELKDGKFSYQLILDDGAEEALVLPTANDAKVLRDLIHDVDTIYWDTQNQVLIFGKIEESKATDTSGPSSGEFPRSLCETPPS